MNEEQTNGTSAQSKTTAFSFKSEEKPIGLAEAAVNITAATLMVAGMTAAFFGVRKLITGH